MRSLLPFARFLRLAAMLGLGACGPGIPQTASEDGSDAAQAVGAHLMEWAILLSPDTIDAGRVTLSVQNGGTDDHELHINGPGTTDEIRLAPDAAAELTLTLRPGSYTLSCAREEAGINHEKRGMRAVLIVQE